jgi:hypothetical protein
MYENTLSKYNRVYSRSPSQLNLVNLWYYKQIERVKEDEHIATEINRILRHMESLGIPVEIPHSHESKPKKLHSGKKAQ